MTLQEYEEIKNSLLKKRKKGNITNKEQGYNEGIETAVSKIREYISDSLGCEQSCPNFIAINQNKMLYIVLDVCYYIVKS